MIINLGGGGGGGKALTMTMTPWNLPNGQWSKLANFDHLTMVILEFLRFWNFSDSGISAILEFQRFWNFSDGHGQEWPILTI